MQARDKTHRPIERDAYHTIDLRVIPALLKHVKPRAGKILEPACGEGYMVRALEAAGYEVYGSDIFDYTKDGSGWRCNFLSTQLNDKSVSAIITNPPNKLNLEFAVHAIKQIEPVKGIVALYQRHEWDATRRTAPIFDHPAYAMKITCRWRPVWFKRGEGETAASPFHRWSWYVWDWNRALGDAPVQTFA